MLIRFGICFLAISVLSLVNMGSLQAQSAAPIAGPVIAVLDVGTIRREAASVKSIREQIINYQNTLQSEIQKEQEALRTAQQELAKKQSLLAPEAFAEERRKFEQRVVGVQQLVQERRRGLEETQNKAMLQVERMLNQIVVSEAEKNGYDMIVRLTQVVFVKKQLDITADVLKELDTKLPTVQVELPKN